MADIKVLCSECNTENTFSEYAKPESRKCRQCGASLAAQKNDAREKLQLRRMDAQGAGKDTLRKTATAKDSKKTNDGTPNTGPRDKHEYTVKVKKPGSFLLGIISFLLFATALVGLQYFAQSDADLMLIYRYVRLAALALAYLLIVLDAFMEGQVPGFFALLILPYTIYYALSKLDGFCRQGLFFAVVVMVGAEMYFMKNDAILTHCDRFVQQQIDYVSAQLEKASNPDVERLE